ncbi:MAG: alkaline phosphatase family protein [Planctomycetaceae bacterium]
MQPLLIVNVVGLTPGLLRHTPRIASIGREGFQAELGGVLPGVTCSAQATLLTGRSPRDHGIVGNGWYFRDLAEVWLWRQSNHLVGCEEEKIWHAGRRRFGDGFTVANLFWWYAMHAAVHATVTPRPVYPVDGRKIPSVYTQPPDLREELQGRLGTFPLFQFWGPGAGIASSRWIAAATRQVMESHPTAVTLCYLPHLDYDLQRFGPDAPEAALACAEIDAVVGDLTDWALDRGHAVVVVSEYGIVPVRDGVAINRALRQAGLLAIQEVDLGWELLDPGASEAFAVADHQLAHVYVRDPSRIAEVRDVLRGIDGVADVLDRETQRDHGLDHPRSGELVAISDADRWFTYYYWLDDQRMPDFARTVDIHRKPGYDPVELFLDPRLSCPKLRIAAKLLARKVGFRTVMDLIGTDPRIVRGSHGRLPDDPSEGPLLICSDRRFQRAKLPMTDVRDLLLDVAGADG